RSLAAFHPSSFRLHPLIRRSVVTLLPLFLRRFDFARTTLRGCSDRRRFYFLWIFEQRFGFDGSLTLRRRHGVIFQPRLSDRTRRGYFVLIGLVGLFVNLHLRAFKLQLALTLFVHLLHVFGHCRSFREIFLRLVFHEVLHEIDEH